jgi:hypothetical protein
MGEIAVYNSPRILFNISERVKALFVFLVGSQVVSVHGGRIGEADGGNKKYQLDSIHACL